MTPNSAVGSSSNVRRRCQPIMLSNESASSAESRFSGCSGGSCRLPFDSIRPDASPEFWARYRSLPAQIQTLAHKSFQWLKSDARHHLLHNKRIREFHSVRVGLFYRALGIEVDDGVLWLWIDTQAEYDKLVG